ncbi:MAG TPA: hypothetical protein VFL82_02355 [Thermomicrobiales bacterium]|nr:hypothetical protein [Thermomicrobiales bacterium]
MLRTRRALLAGALVTLLSFSLLGTALAGPGIRVNPWSYDPDNTGIISAAWVTQEGLPDAGNSNHALFLQKDGPTTANAAAGATVSGAEGQELTELGFDIRNDSYCGAGAPRFNVVTTDGVTHFFGCMYGTHTDLGNGWTQVRFAPEDAFPPVVPGSTIQSIDIVLDEGPASVYLDNIDVNGSIAGKPGKSK